MWIELLKTKSVFSLFPEQSLQGINFEQYLITAPDDFSLEEEGVTSSHLALSLDTPLLLFQKDGNQDVCTGSVGKGRSANLFTFLRNLPSKCSVRTKGPGSVLKIPRSLLESLFASHPEVKSYLLRVTENSSYRFLAKDFQALHLDPVFIVHFIARLNPLRASLNERVVESWNTLAGPIFLSQGLFLLRHKSLNTAPWSIPLRTWVGWKEACQGEVSRVSITSAGECEYFQIKSTDLTQLRSEFKDDFAVLENWIVSGLLPQVLDEDNEYSDLDHDDLEKLFRSAAAVPDQKIRFPIVTQTGEMDCGPACLSMLSLYFRKDLSIQFWRSQLSTGRGGTSLYDLASTAEQNGFITHCLTFNDIADLEKEMFPFVLLRNAHYSVVYKVEKSEVVIGDPARGLVKMKIEEFQSAGEQVGLFLKPNSLFAKLPESRSRWKHYLHLLDGVKVELILAFLCGLASVLLSLVVPAITQRILDDVIGSRDLEKLAFLLTVAAVATGFSVFVSWAKFHYFHHVATRFNFRATTAFVQKMFSLPFHFFASRHVGDFTNRISELSQLRSFLTGTLFEVSMNVTMLSLYAVVLFWVSPMIAGIAILLATVMLVIPVLSSQKMSRLFNQLFELRSAQLSHVGDLVSGIGTIKSTRSEEACKNRFSRDLSDLVKCEDQFFLTSSLVATLTGGIYQFSTLLITGLSAWLGATGQLTAGNVIFIIMIASRLFSPVRVLSRQWDRFVQTKSAVDHLNDIFLSPSEKIIGLNSANSTRKLKGEIEFRDVWFRYGGENSEWVLRDISFKIRAGEKVAIVGPSGSGKSTIACLLTRMYEPTQGTILIDGRDYREYDINFLRSQVGLLHQEPALFNGSILTNIALNEMTADPERAQFAAQRASAQTLILEKPGGFEHIIPHGGGGFSKGEKQRIALARLFYGEPEILILDEATASLDGISEKKIMTTIKHELSNHTVFNIAHRYSTLVYSESAIVLNHGRIAGFGPLEFLKENNLVFQELFNLLPESNPDCLDEVA